MLAQTTVPTLAQSPLFVGTPAPANVMYLLDDSGSMNTVRMPVPGDVAPLLPIGPTVTVGGWSASQLYTLDWELSSPRINALWYNPANHYQPWSNDAVPFPNAHYGGGGSVAAGPLTEWDMRYWQTGTGRVPFTASVPASSVSGSIFGGGLNPNGGVTVQLTSQYSATYNGMDPYTGNTDLFTRGPGVQGCIKGHTEPPPPGAVGACTAWKYTVVLDQQVGTCTAYGPPTSAYICDVPGGPPTPTPVDARYFYFTGSTSADAADPTKYGLVEIDRAKSRDYSQIANRYPVMDATTGATTDSAGNPLTRNDCVAKTWCTFEEEAQNYANWFTYYRTRLYSAIAVTSKTLSGFQEPLYQGLRIGFGRINYFTGAPDPLNPSAQVTVTNVDGQPNPGALMRGVRPFTPSSADRQAFFDWLFGLNGYGNTPTREAVNAIGQYFARSDSQGPWADAPGQSGSQAQSQFNICRRSYTMLTTDGEWTAITGGQPLIQPNQVPPGLDPAGDPTTALHTAASLTIAPGQAAPYLTGVPNFEYAPQNFPQFTGGDQGGSTLSDVTTYYWNRDLLPGVDNGVRPSSTDVAFWQHVNTYIVGYGLDSPMNTAANRAAVRAGQFIAWPTVDTSPTTVTGGNRIEDSIRAAWSSRGDFFAATSVDALATSVKNAFSQFASVSSGGTRVAATNTLVTQGDLIFSAGFASEAWTGSVVGFDAIAYQANSNAPPVWSASIPTFGNRQLITSLGPSSPSLFDYPSVGGNFGSAAVFNYLAGDSSLEGTQFRTRATLLGDIVNSSPLYSAATDYLMSSATAGGSTYADYLKAKQARTPAVYVGANDGFLHAFKVTSVRGASGDGSEVFGYVPRAVMAKPAGGTAPMEALASVNYQHQYYVDGPPVEGDVYFGGAWHTVLFGSDGAGPIDLFALDTTNVESTTALWDLVEPDVPADVLGHVLHPGVVGATADSAGSIYVVGNGVHSLSGDTHGVAALLVINAATGQVVKSLTVSDGNTGENGLGGVAAVYDGARNIIAAYAGDLHGNLWKFDLSGSSSNWQPAFSGRPLTSVGAPITAAPLVTENSSGGYNVAFGTGKLFDVGDDADVSTQVMGVVWDTAAAGETPVPMSSMAQAFLGSNSGARTVSLTKPVNWSTQRGWFVALDDSSAPGERVLGTPEALGNNVLFSTFTPRAGGVNSCVPLGTTYAYTVDIQSASGTGSQSTGAVAGLVQLTTVQPNVGATSSSPNGTPVDTTSGVTPSALGPSRLATVNCSLLGTTVSSSVSKTSTQCPSSPTLRQVASPQSR